MICSIITLTVIQLAIQLPFYAFAPQHRHRYVRLVALTLLWALAILVVPQFLVNQYELSMPVEYRLRPRCGMPGLAITFGFLLVYSLVFLIVQLGIVEVFRLIINRSVATKNG